MIRACRALSRSAAGLLLYLRVAARRSIFSKQRMRVKGHVTHLGL